jgi:hypothetical protein
MFQHPSGVGLKPAPVLFLFLLLISFVPPASATPRGVEFCLDPLDAKVIDHLAALGFLTDVHVNTRPIDPYELALSNRLKSTDLSPSDASLLAKLSSLTRRVGLDVVLSAGDGWAEGEGGFTLRQADDRLVLHDRISISREERYLKIGETASSRTKRWKWDYRADFVEAYAKIYFGRAMLYLGRHGIFWGPARFGALGISDNSPAFDMFMASLYGERLSAYTFTAVLDEMWNDQRERYLARRFLAGHRLDWIVWDGLEIGLTEVILYGGDLRRLDPGYLNPLIPYYATQHNFDYDDNTLVSADFSWLLSSGVMAYGELMIDDLQYSGEGPNAWGFTLGTHLAGWSDLIVEYTRLNRWAYTHRVTECQYLHYGSSIGYPFGPDGDQITAEWSKFLSSNLWAGIRLGYKRKGEASIEDRYEGGAAGQVPFPSGVVERRIGVGLEIIYRPLRGLWGRISFEGERIQNRSHRTGVSSRDMRLNLELGYILSVGG